MQFFRIFAASEPGIYKLACLDFTNDLQLFKGHGACGNYIDGNLQAFAILLTRTEEA